MNNSSQDNSYQQQQKQFQFQLKNNQNQNESNNQKSNTTQESAKSSSKNIKQAQQRGLNKEPQNQSNKNKNYQQKELKQNQNNKNNNCKKQSIQNQKQFVINKHKINLIQYKCKNKQQITNEDPRFQSLIQQILLNYYDKQQKFTNRIKKSTVLTFGIYVQKGLNEILQELNISSQPDYNKTIFENKQVVHNNTVQYNLKENKQPQQKSYDQSQNKISDFRNLQSRQNLYNQKQLEQKSSVQLNNDTALKTALNWNQSQLKSKIFKDNDSKIRLYDQLLDQDFIIIQKITQLKPTLKKCIGKQIDYFIQLKNEGRSQVIIQITNRQLDSNQKQKYKNISFSVIKYCNNQQGNQTSLNQSSQSKIQLNYANKQKKQLSQDHVLLVQNNNQQQQIQNTDQLSISKNFNNISLSNQNLQKNTDFILSEQQISQYRQQKSKFIQIDQTNNNNHQYTGQKQRKLIDQETSIRKQLPSFEDQLQELYNGTKSIATSIIRGNFQFSTKQQQDKVYEFINQIRKDPNKLKQLIQLQTTTVNYRQKQIYRYFQQKQIEIHIRQLQSFHDDKLQILKQICRNEWQIYYVYQKQQSKFLFNSQVLNQEYQLIKIKQQQKYTLNFNYSEEFKKNISLMLNKQQQQLKLQQQFNIIFLKFNEMKWENVITLNLSNSNIVSLQLYKLINELLQSFPLLQILDLSNNRIQYINQSQLNILNHHQNLKQINLLSNYINKNTFVNTIKSMILSQSKYKVKLDPAQLQQLDLSKFNKRGQIIIKTFWNIYSDLNIKSLDLSQNLFTDYDFQFVIEYLYLFGSLKFINLRKNKIYYVCKKNVTILQQYCNKNVKNFSKQKLVINLQHYSLNKINIYLLNQRRIKGIKFVFSNNQVDQTQQNNQTQQQSNLNFAQNINQNQKSYQNRLLLWSSILNEQNLHILKKWLIKDINQIQLKFKASKYDFQIKKYFEICGNLTNTIIIAKTIKGKIIGGYTPLSFNPSQELIKYQYKSKLEELICYQPIKDKSNSTFLFSLSENHKFQLIQKNKDAITRWKNKSCISFSNTFQISDKSNIYTRNSFKLGKYNYSTYYYNTFQYSESKQSYLKITGQQNELFATAQWQVYQVFFK